MIATAHGKLLLFGEHAAVYGYPALGLQLPEAITIRYQPGSAGLTFTGAPPTHQGPLNAFLSFLTNEELSVRPQVGNYQIESTVALAAGFGSSGALCAALAYLAIKQAGQVPDQARVWPLAHEYEGFFHLTPSGIDTGLAIWPGVRYFTRREGHTLPDQIPIQLPAAWLTYAAVARSRSTKTLVGSIRTRLENGDAQVRQTIAELGQLASVAKDLRSMPDGAVQVGRLAAKAHEGLNSLGLGDPIIDTLLAEAHSVGSLGGKLSGAGGGGAFWALAATKADAHRIAELWKTVASRDGLLMVAEPRVLAIRDES